MKKEKADDGSPAGTKIYSLEHSKPGIREFQLRDQKLFDRPFWIAINKNLMKAFGWQDALILTRFDYWICESLKNEGRARFYKTYAEMKEQDFPLWEEYTIQTRVLNLENRGFIVPMGHPTKWYYLDYARIQSEFQKHIMGKTNDTMGKTNG